MLALITSVCSHCTTLNSHEATKSEGDAAEERAATNADAL